MNHPLVDDTTQLSTHDIIDKVRCEAAETVQAYFDKQDMTGWTTKLKAENKQIRAKQTEIATLGEGAHRLLDHYKAREKDLDSLIIKRSEISSLIVALESIVTKLRKEIESATDPVQIDALEQLLEKTAKRIAVVTDEAFLVGELPTQVRKEMQAFVDGLNAGLEGTNGLCSSRARGAKQNDLKEATSMGCELGAYQRTQKKLQQEIEAIKKKIGQGGYASAARFNQATLAMLFEFEITENNNATGSGSLTWPIHLGTFSLGWSAGSERRRLSEREASTATDFEKLMDHSKLYCRTALLADRDRRARRYPITGNVGMAEFMDQYFRVSDTIDIQSGKESFKEKLTFTTKVKGGVTPSVELAPVSPSKVSAKLDLNADRQDLHAVTVAIYPADRTRDSTGSPTTVNIEAVPELSVRVTKGTLDRYLKVGRDVDGDGSRAGR